MNTAAHISISEHLLNRNSATNDRQTRHKHMIACQTLIIMTALCGGFAAGISYLMTGQVPTTLPPEVQEAIKQAISVMDDGKLRIVCIIGAMGGGVLSALLYPLGSPKQLSGKIVGSAISGIMFSPKLLSWMSWQLTTDNVLCMAGAVALLSWTLLQLAIPLAGAWFTSKFKTPPGA